MSDLSQQIAPRISDRDSRMSHESMPEPCKRLANRRGKEEVEGGGDQGERRTKEPVLCLPPILLPRHSTSKRPRELLHLRLQLADLVAHRGDLGRRAAITFYLC